VSARVTLLCSTGWGHLADDTARLASILRQFPRSLRALEVGCGSCPGLALCAAPGAVAVGLDLDLAALRQARRQYPGVWLVQADSARLPFRDQFDLILVRHPDLDRHRNAWEWALRDLASLLSDSGLLLVTAYSAPEIETARGWLTRSGLAPVPPIFDQLIPPGLSGRDRFALAYRKLT
jgi:ubiquinone/menaquinone biosynthesis C-methylase UbiE